ncbi:Sigma intracellular receptor [Lachnellula suecica]|uniref:Sigma intracellular receptor n=1 Tax=Lachnellula suecica TaxID=602035 RepID=A0A8T9BT42_9HELO|nr:Sigma intracellular receptor [Lachnellula suecica]
MFLMDLQAIYPPSVVPGFMLTVKNYYIKTYKDQFFVNPPPFFKLFIWSEILFQAPVTVWALGGLYRNSPKIPLVLLPYAIVVFLTTLTCMVEYASWEVPLADKIELTKLYGPYLAIATFMIGDMYLRLDGVISRASAASGGKKVQ